MGPCHQRVGQLVEYLLGRAARPLENPERVIPALNQVQGRSRLQVAANRPQQIELGKIVTSPLQEKHRQVYQVEVLGPIGSRPAWRVKRKAEKGQSPNARQGAGGRRTG